MEMQVTREVALDQSAEDVWRLLVDPEELAGWVGDEVRTTTVTGDDATHRLTWTWSPDGVESSVEISLTEDDGRTLVRVVERSTSPAASASARACAIHRWDGALLSLELRALTWTHRLVAR